MKTVLSVFGTRPEAIKMAPLIACLRERGRVRSLSALSGQHPDMTRGILEAFGVSADVDLSLVERGMPLPDLHSALYRGIVSLYRAVRPDLVLVHGDTATALAAAMAAFFLEIPIGHVEAGLRSHHPREPFPEEMNRRAITLLSELDFAPTERAACVLAVEGKKNVFLSGNTVVDALQRTVTEDFHHPLLESCGGRRIVFVTAHRRESLGDPLRRIFHAVVQIAEDFDDIAVILPLHKSPRVREAAEEVFGARKHPRIFLTEPIGAVACHNLLARASLILTDSGGLQEEGTALGVPIVVLRDRTERQEAVESGGAILAGREEAEIVSAAVRVLSGAFPFDRGDEARLLFGDGRASLRIAETVEAFLFRDRDALDKRRYKCYNEL